MLNNNLNFYFCAQEPYWMNIIVDRINVEMVLKQISVFTFKRLSHYKDDDLILSIINKRFPTTLINLEEVSSFKSNNKFIFNSYENPRQLSWFLIVLRNNCNKPNIQKVKDVFEFLSLNTTAPRPKILTLPADLEKWNIEEFKNILLFAWHNKYLDFSIIGKNSDGNLKILYYNPFTENHFIGNFDQNTKIFPDKMRDMLGYPLRFPVFNYLPLLRLKNSSNLNVKEIADGLYYFYFKVICKTRNCTLIDLILDTQNVICITFDYRANYYVDKNLDSNGKTLMKIVDSNLYGDYLAFSYEDNSPFMEKFDETMKRITQSGLEKHLKYLETKPKIIETTIEQFEDPYLKYRIVIVFIVGITLSILSFGYEILIFKYYKKKRSNFVNCVN